jgi:hypothetical protein
MLPKSIIIAYNTDSFTIIHPCPKAIADAEEIYDNKDDFENMGKLKIEHTIKVKGKGFACKEKDDDSPEPFMYEKKKIKIYIKIYVI